MDLLNIRTAIRQDAVAIATIQIQAWRLAYNGIMPKKFLDSLSVEQQSQQWQNALNNNIPDVKNLVINFNDALSGFCVYGPARDHDLSNQYDNELVALNIAPHAWGNKLATALIQQVLQAAQQNKKQAVYLWVIQQNTRARGLYESLGFELDGCEKFDTQLTGYTLHEIRYIKKVL